MTTVHNIMSTPALLRSIAMISLVVCAGCATTKSQRDDLSYAPTMPNESFSESSPADGAIFHNGQNLELFTDPRAHRVGDILTVTLMEKTEASKKSSTTTSKKSSTELAAPTLLGKVPTVGGTAASIGLSGNRDFAGAGESSQSNELTGEVTVTVAQRLANGNLLLRGEKWLTINQGQELVRISGIVRPQDIAPDNTVPSTRVADARIAYTARGTLADANTQGWLSRFFNSKWLPF